MTNTTNIIQQNTIYKFNGFDTNMGNGIRKSTGSFYTNPLIAKLVVQDTFSSKSLSKETINGMYILEPSMGDGEFVVQIINYLKNTVGITPQEAIKHIVAIDINRDSVEVAISRISNIFNIDTEEVKKSLFVCDFFEFITKPETQNKFDFIIGNPPFGNIENQGEYKNIALSFASASLNILKQDGILAFVMPQTFSRVGGEALKWRKSIKDNLFAIHDYGEVFLGVTLETCCYFFKKETVSMVHSKSFRDSIKLDKKAKALKVIEISRFGNIVPKSVFWSKEDTMVIYADNDYQKLLSHNNDKIKLMGKRGVDYPSRILKKEKETNTEFVVNGKNIAKGELVHINGYDKFLNKDDANGKISITDEESVLITQFGNKLKACIVPKGTIYSGGCVLVKEANNKLTNQQIADFLNNPKTERYLQRYIFNEAKLTVHIDGCYLERLPYSLIEN